MDFVIKAVRLAPQDYFTLAAILLVVVVVVGTAYHGIKGEIEYRRTIK